MNNKYYERHLPHWIPDQTPIFVTWRLAGTLSAEDAGPRWLGQPAIARITANALLYGEREGKYQLHAWVIMPNHVHAVITPQAPYSEIMRWLKWTTARRSNKLLGLQGYTFWQDESYDHWIRTSAEFRSIVHYVESNPVRSGLVDQPEQWQWSSAGKTGDKIACPTSTT